MLYFYRYSILQQQQNNNIFMNKFYKTSYPKTSSINQILKNKKQLKKQTFRKQQILNNHIQTYKQTLTQDIKQKPKFHLDNKIQIDSDLLFNKNQNYKKTTTKGNQWNRGQSIDKVQQRKTLLQQIQKRKQQNKTESGFYQIQQEKQEQIKIRIRPQSKQQTRARLFTGFQSKRNQFHRPQTSKGSRKNVTNQRLISLEDENDIDIIISRNRKISKKQERQRAPVQHSEKGKKKHNFQTSIDDEFLSLFAN